MFVRKRLLYVLSYVAALIVASYGTAQAVPQQPFKVEGYITDYTGAKVGGATITVRLQEDNTDIIITDNITGASGYSATSASSGDLIGIYSIQIPIDDPDTPASEGAKVGDTVHVFANGTEAPKTLTVAIGGKERLDIQLPEPDNDGDGIKVSADCDDNDDTKWQNLKGYTDEDGDQYGVGDEQTVCAGNSLPSNMVSSNNYKGQDCDDNDKNKFQNVSFYKDNDKDGYGAGTGTEPVCTGSDATAPTGYSTNNTDCDDNDDTKWQNLKGYTDEDGDQYGVGDEQTVCAGNSLPSNMVSSNNYKGQDCDDNAKSKYKTWNGLYADTDADGHGTGDVLNDICSDNEHTGYADNNTDNCPNDDNPDQVDTDKDGKGDVCDNWPYTDDTTLTDSDGDGNPDDADNDGVPDDIECQGITGCDANNDGISDATQVNVARMEMDKDKNAVVIEAKDSDKGNTVKIQQLKLRPDLPTKPVIDKPNAELELKWGIYDLQLNEATSAAGFSTTLTITLPSDAKPNVFYKYGYETAADKAAGKKTWYEFMYDGETGAEINDNVITLYFVDGKRGDDDWTANGVIVDPGAPGVLTTGASLSDTSSDSRCFIATAAYGSPFERHVATLRQFRDQYLLPTTVGRELVELYYEYSPPAARFIAEHDTLRGAVRIALLPVVGISSLLLTLGPVAGSLVLAGILLGLTGGAVIVARRRR